jgi:hypothetical protein
VTSIERTAYPRFGRLVTARESDGLVPVAEEVEWARAASRSEEHLLSLVVALKCFQRLGYFPRAGAGAAGDGRAGARVSGAGRCGGVAAAGSDRALVRSANGSPASHRSYPARASEGSRHPSDTTATLLVAADGTG